MPDPSESADEQNAASFNIQRYLNVASRRHMFFLIPLLIGWLLVWGASWVLPARYKSSTLILVEQPTMPKNYVEPNVAGDLQDRLQSITQQILSRTRLLLIIDRLNLYNKGHKQLSGDEKVEAMRKDIEIELVHDNHDQHITAFKIYYSAQDPKVAQLVTGELTDLFINDNLKVRQQQSEDTTQFINDRLDSARASLAEQEAKVRDFEAKHEGELPTQQTSNLQILSGLQSQLQNEEDALNSAKQQGIYLRSLIEHYRAIRSPLPTTQGGPVDLPGIDRELDSLKAKLAALSAHYTDRHPDIQNLKEEIARTEKLKGAFLAGVKGNAKGANQSDDEGVGSDAQNGPALQLESQLRANQAEVSNREHAISALTNRINEYQARLNSEPAVEQQLADLTRGYEQSKANYDGLLKKENDSEMATSMEQMQQGERFKMLDPPSLPQKPDFPDRLKLCGIGVGVGLALGLAIAGGFEFFDGRLHDEGDIKALVPVPLISEIPEIPISSEDQDSKKRMLLGWATAVLVVGAILTGSAFSYLHQ